MQLAGCQNHPARDAIGVCVQCRQRVCGECATKIEGINYCVHCLSGLAAVRGQIAGGRGGALEAGHARPASSRRVVVVVVVQLLTLSAAILGLLQLMLPG